MKPGMKATVAFAIALLIIVLVGVCSFIGIQQVTDSNRMVTHTHEVMEKQEHVLSLIKDAETGQRGFVLTGDERYLEPYNTAVGNIWKEIDSLTSLTKDNPVQQQSIQQLALLSREKLDEVQETIKLRREGGLNAALAVISSDRGLHNMDEIRKIVAQMDAREWQLLDKRNRIAGTVALHNSWIVGIGFLMSLLMLSATAVIFTRTLRLADRGTRPAGADGKWPVIAIRYMFALAIVALAMLVRQWLVSSFGPLPTFVIFYPAILLVASIAGGGPGIMATLLSVLAAAYWYFPPFGSFNISSPNDAIALGIFGGASLFLCLLAERLHRARWAEAVSVTQEQELALLDMGNLLALDMDHRIMHWSKGCSRLYGFDAQEAQGHLADELLQTHFPQTLDQINHDLLERGYWEGELTRRSKDGTEMTLVILLALRRDDHGKPLAILEVSTDITHQKNTEAALRENETHLEVVNDNLEIANEELQAQSEELQAQREELQAQNQELEQLWEESRRTAESLAESQERLSLALISSGMATFDWDIVADKRIWDDNVHSLLGTSPETFTGTAEEFFRVLYPEDRSAVQVALSKAIETTGEYETEYRAVWPDGTIHHIAARGKLHRNRAGRADRMVGVCWDITERKRTEEALHESEELFRTLADSIPQFCWMANADGWIFWYNHRWYEYTGTTPEQMEGWGWQSVHDPEVLPQVIERWKVSIATGKPFDMVFPIRGSDGLFRPFLTRGMPVYNQDGKVLRWFGTNTDITERKQAEEALNELNEELEYRVVERTENLAATIEKLQVEIAEREKAQESVLRLNRLYAVLSETNQAIVRTMDRETLLNDFCRIAVEDGSFKLAWVGLVDEESSELKIVAAKGATGYLEDLRITVNEEPAGIGPTGLSVREGTYYVCNDFLGSPITRPWHERGKAHGIRASSSIALKQEGRVIGALTLYADKKDFFDQQQVELLQQMGADVSFALDNIVRENRRQEAESALREENAERLRTMEALREKEQMLIQQSRQAAMGEMIGNIAHQWRQPLNTLGLKIQQLLLFYDLGEFTREFLEKGVSSSMGLIQHMSKTIDDFRNYFNPDKEKVEFKVREAIENTLSLLDGSLKNPQISIEIVAKDDPAIYGYQNEFAQVLLNILINARDALIEGDIYDPRVTITISTEDGCAVVTVADNAGGIPKDIIDKIFDPYFTTKGPQQGTGVGLFMSKTIIEKNMGGKLSVRNVANGAQFRIEV